jgi:hypothetical protein
MIVSPTSFLASISMVGLKWRTGNSSGCPNTNLNTFNIMGHFLKNRVIFFKKSPSLGFDPSTLRLTAPHSSD